MNIKPHDGIVNFAFVIPTNQVELLPKTQHAKDRSFGIEVSTNDLKDGNTFVRMWVRNQDFHGLQHNMKQCLDLDVSYLIKTEHVGYNTEHTHYLQLHIGDGNVISNNYVPNNYYDYALAGQPGIIQHLLPAIVAEVIQHPELLKDYITVTHHLYQGDDKQTVYMMDYDYNHLLKTKDSHALVYLKLYKRVQESLPESADKMTEELYKTLLHIRNMREGMLTIV